VGYTAPWAAKNTPARAGAKPSATRGYTATKDQLQARLKRIEGQVRGVQGMVEDDRWCPDILVQISAIQAALDKVALGLADGHARHCVIGGPDSEKEQRTDELMIALGRLVRGG
jgi:DNA-binding FrmR family transcriptional regulator